jgi:hypothetical protein
MNYLTLCQTVREKCGITGTGPASVSNATGEMLRIVNWVNEAWEMIQRSAPDLYFMEAVDTSLTTTAKQIAVPDDFSEVISLVLTTGSSKSLLRYVPRKIFDQRHIESQNLIGRPQEYCVKGNNIVFNKAPADITEQLILTYTKKPTTLTENDDEPDMPTKYHWLIVYKAMELYGFYENAQEIIQQGKMDYDRLYRDMQRGQRSPIVKARAMA